MTDETTRIGMPRPAGATLVHVQQDGHEDQWPLDEEIVIGRVGGDVVIRDDRYVSGRHAAVRREGGGYVLHDLGSTNGTYARIRGEIELRPGDHILIGSQVFRFVT